MVEGRVVDFNMNGFSRFSANLFAILAYYLEVGDVGLGAVIGNTLFANCTGDMTIVFFYSIFQMSAGFFCVKKVAIFFWAGPSVNYALF